METAQQDASARAYEPPPELNVDTKQIAGVIEQQQDYKEQNIDEIFEQIDENMWKQFGLDVANDVIMTGMMFGVGYAVDGLMNHSLKRPVKGYKYNEKISLDENIDAFMKNYEKQAQYINGEIDKIMYDGFTKDILKNEYHPEKFKKITKKEYDDRLNNISYQQSIMNKSKQDMIQKIQENQQKLLQDSATRHRVDLDSLNKQLTDLQYNSVALTNSINDQEKLIQQLNNDIVRKSDTIQGLQIDIEEEQQRLQRIQKQERIKLAEKDVEKAEVKEKIENVNATITDIKEEQQEAQKQLDKTKKQLKKVQKSKNVLEKKQGSNLQQQQQVANELKDIKQQYSREVGEWLDDFEGIDEKIIARLKNYDDEIYEPKKLDEIFQHQDDYIDELMQIRDKYEGKNGIIDKKAQHTDIVENMFENAEKINKADNEILKINEDLAESNRKIEEANKKDAEMQEQLGKHQTDLETIDNKILKLKENSQKVQAPIQQSIKDLKEEISNTEHEIAQITKNRESLKQQQSELQTKLNDTQKTIDNIQQILQSGKIVELQKRIEKLVSQHKFTANDTMQTYDGTKISGLEEDALVQGLGEIAVDEVKKGIKKSVSPRAQKAEQLGEKLGERQRQKGQEAREELHTDQFEYRQKQMQDIINSVENDKKDMENIIEEYKKINKEINELFDIHTLPLPEEYITPKNQINWSSYKQAFNDFYDYKMKQYKQYDRKRYQKYDKPLNDDNEFISEIDQKWLKDNKQSYQLDLLKDTLSNGNTVDIKQLSQLLGDYKPQTVIKQPPMNKQYNTVLSEIRNAESELKNAQAALDKIQGEKATLEKTIEQQIDPLIQEQIEKLTEPIKNAQIEKNKKQSYYNDRAEQKKKIDSNYRALRNLFDRGPGISDLRYKYK